MTTLAEAIRIVNDAGYAVVPREMSATMDYQIQEHLPMHWCDSELIYNEIIAAEIKPEDVK